MGPRATNIQLENQSIGMEQKFQFFQTIYIHMFTTIVLYTATTDS